MRRRLVLDAAGYLGDSRLALECYGKLEKKYDAMFDRKLFAETCDQKADGVQAPIRS